MRVLTFIIIIIWIYSPSRALASPFRSFLTITFLRGWIVSPAPNPQPGGAGFRIYDPPGTGWPSYTLRHWVPILVAFYDMHGLQWDCSLIPATTRDDWFLANSYITLLVMLQNGLLWFRNKVIAVITKCTLNISMNAVCFLNCILPSSE
jgi:hypothetical protein